MDIFDAIRKRRSVRRFADNPVEDGKLDAIFEAVRQSPSWSNMQCWRFIAVRDAAARQRLSELSNVESFFAPLGYKSNPARKGLAEAPVVIVACAEPSKSGTIRGQEYYLVDMGIASQTLMLAARGLGLGTVFVGVYDEDGARSLLGIPQSVRVVGLFPLGYPLEEKDKGLSRLELNEIFVNDKWGW